MMVVVFRNRLREGVEQVYGEHATDQDRIRASQMLTQYCNAGSQLPAAAPAFPF